MLFYHNSCYAMGTRLNMVLAQPLLGGDFIFDQVVNEVNRLERKLSRFDPDSDISLINEHAGTQPVRVDTETANILWICRDYCQRTCGAFDITLPSKADVLQKDKAAVSSNYSIRDHALIIDLESLTVAFSDPVVQIDPGGFGKGYAIGKIRDILKDNGIQNALVSFGESSILAMGHHPYGDCWKIGLADGSEHVFELRDQALSTSGFHKETNNLIGFHIISPQTLQPVESYSSISVVSPDPLEAEILSTALFAWLDMDRVFLDNFQDYQIIRVDYNKERFREICTHER